MKSRIFILLLMLLLASNGKGIVEAKATNDNNSDETSSEDDRSDENINPFKTIAKPIPIMKLHYEPRKLVSLKIEGKKISAVTTPNPEIVKKESNDQINEKSSPKVCIK